MEVDKIPKHWEWEVCRIEKEHNAENTHINIDNTIDGGGNSHPGVYSYFTYRIYK